ncbi:hypothetical protein KDN24_05475 [Bacillus sp. Bva_UNVM-123]|uniref:hypothetical protein n=1 Tax=Bacillus sp. Bva_UNVM-123 TaxID=2829798 RepID=UPI00391F65D5
MIYQLLNTMYHLNIQIKEVERKTKLVYDPGLLNEKLKEQIRLHKKSLIQRLEENEGAKKIGFIVYSHGQLYEYRYGRGAFLYIERLPNGHATAWRENYLPDQSTAYKTIVIVTNVRFEKAFEQATSFINWLNKKRNRKVG